MEYSEDEGEAIGSEHSLLGGEGASFLSQNYYVCLRLLQLLPTDKIRSWNIAKMRLKQLDLGSHHREEKVCHVSDKISMCIENRYSLPTHIRIHVFYR